MRILFLTFYFEPDLCAGSFRSSALIQELTKYKDIKIDVVTTKPNRYVHYEQHADAFEILSENVHVYRIKTSSHKSGLLDQIISFTHYFLGTRKLVKGREYDFIFASSSRLFTAYLGALIARKMGKPLYLDRKSVV